MVWLLLPTVAVMATVVKPVTPKVVTGKVAVVAPGATVTEGGTDAQPRFDDRLTRIPFGPAAACRVTDPVAVVPP